VTRAAGLETGVAEAYDGLAYVAMELGEHERANALYRRATEIEPTIPRFLYACLIMTLFRRLLPPKLLARLLPPPLLHTVEFGCWFESETRCPGPPLPIPWSRGILASVCKMFRAEVSWNICC
jgi:hypothetical protein